MRFEHIKYQFISNIKIWFQWSLINGPQNMREIRFSSSVKKYSRPNFTNSLIDNFPSPFLSMIANETAASSGVSPKHLKNNLYSVREIWPEWSLSTA